MFGCSIKHSFETERQFPVILLIAKFWQFSSLRHIVEQVNASLEKKKKYYSLSIDFFNCPWGPSILYVVSMGGGEQPQRRFTTQTLLKAILIALTLLNKKRQQGGRESKIADFETTQFMDGPMGCHWLLFKITMYLFGLSSI